MAKHDFNMNENQILKETQVVSRLSAVEASYSRLHEDVQSLSKKIDYGLENIRDQISVALRDSNAAHKTNWGVIISAATAFIAVMLLAFAPVLWLANKNYDSIERMHEDFVIHIRDGHGGR